MELYHSRARIHEANHSIALNTAVVELWRAGEELRAGFQLRLGGGITLLGAPPGKRRAAVRVRTTDAVTRAPSIR
jgi:hypothetical protein